ncbi:MAG: hypothetical protein Q4D38_14830, partial [Planctomycetia bacterium]|nr:hypothetical protein [Planctomycetia bacterium]
MPPTSPSPHSQGRSTSLVWDWAYFPPCSFSYQLLLRHNAHSTLRLFSLTARGRLRIRPLAFVRFAYA